MWKVVGMLKGCIIIPCKFFCQATSFSLYAPRWSKQGIVRPLTFKSSIIIYPKVAYRLSGLFIYLFIQIYEFLWDDLAFLKWEQLYSASPPPRPPFHTFLLSLIVARFKTDFSRREKKSSFWNPRCYVFIYTLCRSFRSGWIEALWFQNVCPPHLVLTVWG